MTVLDAERREQEDKTDKAGETVFKIPFPDRTTTDLLVSLCPCEPLHADT